MRDLLAEHLAEMRDTSPADSVHALPLGSLTAPEVRFWRLVGDHGELLGIAALKELSADQAEVKSMRTATAARGRGVARRLLEHLISVAIGRGYRQLLLETGSQDHFAPARRLYQHAGFTSCAPFAHYRPDPNSVFYRLDLASRSLAASYDTLAASYAELLPDTSFEGPLERALIAEFAANVDPRARVLDAGCGTGRMLDHLHQLEPSLRLAGCDLSPEMVRIATSAHPGAELAVAPLADLPWPDGAFEAVLSWYSIIHTAPADLPATIAELLRALTPGGQLLLGFHAGSPMTAPQVRVVESAYGQPVRLEVQLHPVDGIVEILRAAGAEVVTVIDRGARAGHERNRQGFILAIRRQDA